METSKQYPRYTQYKHDRKEHLLNIRLNNYFTYLESVIEQRGQTHVDLMHFSPLLFKAFSKLNVDEQIRYICSNYEYVVKAGSQSGGKKYANMLNETSYQSEKNVVVEATCQISTSNPFKLLCSPSLVFKLNEGKETAILLASGAKETLNLHHYLVTRTGDKKLKLIPAMDSSKLYHQVKKHELCFEKGIATEIYQKLFSIIMHIRNEELLLLLSEITDESDNQKLAQERKSYEVLHNKVFLGHKNFKEYLKFKQGAHIRLNEQHKFFQPIRSSTSENKFKSIQILRSKKQQSLYELKAVFADSSKNLHKAFIQVYEDYKLQRSRLVVESQILQERDLRQYQAVYQKYQFANISKQMIFLKEVNLNKSGNLYEKEVLFIKGIENIILVNFLSFLSAKIRDKGASQSELIIHAEFNLSKYVDSDFVIEYFEDLCDMLQDSNENRMITPTFSQHSSVKFDYSRQKMKQNCQQAMEEEEEMGKKITYEFGETDEHDNGVLAIQKSSYENEQEEIRQFIYQKYKRHPIENFPLEKHKLQKHYLEDEWVRDENGGMLCTNEELLTEHKKMFKIIITSIGSNILKGNNVLNVSLPVVIFKKQSHLQMIATSFSMAPRLLEGITDKLERMKHAVLMMIAVGNLGISIEKPFYPHLGETLQVWIGGCPMYFEQISRYPQIGAYYLKGRGYEVYGQVEPKIGFGLNTGKGYNERPSYIKFDDGTLIEVSYAKMLITGLFFGSRGFSFEGKMFAYDRKNRLFAEVNYGARDTHLISKDDQPQDFIYGKIYQTTPEFQKKFEQQIPRKYPKEKYQVRTVSKFQGIWNQVISFDGKPYFDFRKELPCAVQYENYPLPSDCRYRKDLSEFIKGNIEEAQKQKEEMEESIRRDRKLRNQFGNKK